MDAVDEKFIEPKTTVTENCDQDKAVKLYEKVFRNRILLGRELTLIMMEKMN